MKVVKRVGKWGLSTGRYAGRTISRNYGTGVLQFSIDLALTASHPLIPKVKFVRTQCLV